MKTKSEKGFTLLELIAAMAILAILVSMAVPSFEGMINSSARRSALSTIQGDLAAARNEAVSRSEQVVMCSSSNASTCAGSTSWETGWILFLDRNANGVPNFGSGSCATTEDCLVKSQSDLPAGVTLRAASGSIRFNEMGERTGGASNLQLCGKNAAASGDTSHSHTLSMLNSGSLLVEKGSTTCP